MTLISPNPFPAKSATMSKDKERGGYYTSAVVASWLALWAVRSPNDRVLEPSCGDGVFVEAVAERLLELGCDPAYVDQQISGVELMEEEATKASERLGQTTGVRARSVVCGDFFEWHRANQGSLFSCVVGNPPFIRYQAFPEPSRSLAMRLMQSEGMKPNMLTNIWVPFVVGAVSHLADGGRIALVVPAELLQVSYAAQLREYLLRRFKTIDVIACNHLFFQDAQQEVVLLLADHYVAEPSPSHRCHIHFVEVQSVEQLSLLSIVPNGPRPRAKGVRHDREKWLKYFLTPYEIGLMRRLRDSGAVTTLETYAHVDVGVVTGNNAFFVMSRQYARSAGLSEHLSPIIGRSSQLRGAVLRESDVEELAESGEKVLLLNVPKDAPAGEALRQYIRYGESAAVHKGYKCSIRNPWYSVPSVWVPDAFLFRQIYDFPRPVLNCAGATSTDTVHRMRCKADSSKVVSALYTHLAGASAEIVGRSYGGGVLELEPTEAEQLLLPANLRFGLPLKEVDRLIRKGDVEAVLEQNDRLLLEHAGLSDRDVRTLKRIWLKMQNRRFSRRRTGV